jgi:hypothetical protein
MFLLRRSPRSFLTTITHPIKRFSSGEAEDPQKKLYDK